MKRHLCILAALCTLMVNVPAQADFHSEMTATQLDTQTRAEIAKGTSIDEIVKIALKAGIDPGRLMVVLDHLGIAPEIVAHALTKSALIVGVQPGDVPAWLANLAATANLDPSVYIAAAAAGPGDGGSAAAVSMDTSSIPVFSSSTSTLSGGGKTSVSKS